MLTKNNKINYISRETKIGAENLNNIQDSVLYNTEKVKKLSKDTEEISSQLEQIGSSLNGVDIGELQIKTDNNLETIDKTIVGAINEINKRQSGIITNIDGGTF